MMTLPAILKVDAGGLPMAWIHWQTAVTLYARNQVRWEAGDERFLIRGGINAVTGCRSSIEIGSIVAVSGHGHRLLYGAPSLSNRTLFERDRNLCLYCGRNFPVHQLTRDHVVPVSRGGLDVWENCVTACGPCNQRKNNRTPEQASMRLLAVPYTPNRAEYLILSNRRILADQMEFLLGYTRARGQ